ncbi:MAG: hypothetical protein ACTSUE_24570 [Promethearchaeota archaeon]
MVDLIRRSSSIDDDIKNVRMVFDVREGSTSVVQVKGFAWLWNALRNGW